MISFCAKNISTAFSYKQSADGYRAGKNQKGGNELNAPKLMVPSRGWPTGIPRQGSKNCHIGAIIIAAERSKRYLDATDDLSRFIDSRIDGFANENQIGIRAPSRMIALDEAKRKVASALLKTCGRLHYIAHDVVAGTYALIALGEMSGEVDGNAVDAVCANIEGLLDAPPGHFYKLGFKAVQDAEKRFPDNGMISDERELADTAIAFLKSVDPVDCGLVPAPFEPIRLGSKEYLEKLGDERYDGHLFKTTFSLFDLKNYGLVSDADAGFVIDSKYPYPFSMEPISVPGSKQPSASES